MTPLHRVKRVVDREWIRVGWAGFPTLNHRLIAMMPLLIVIPVAWLIEPLSYSSALVVVLIGLFLSVAALVWIIYRQWAGIGAFLTKRSEQTARRSRAKRQRSAR